MASAPQHSDLLFDFGPKGFPGEGARVDWVTSEPPPFDSGVGLEIPQISFSSRDPLPVASAAVPVSDSPPAGPASAAGPAVFWLNGDAILCACPDCSAPMTVRTWLMLADCWRCGVSIQLSEEQIRQVERIAARQSAPVLAPPAPAKVASPSPAIPPPHRRPATQPAITRAEAPPARAETAAAPPRPKRQPLELRGPVPAAPLSPAPLPAASAPPAAKSPPPPAKTPSPRPARPLPRHIEDDEDSLDILRALFADMPSWLLSFIFHLLLLILLALVQPKQTEEGPWITLTASISKDAFEGGDAVQILNQPDARFDLPLPKPDDLNDPAKRKALLAANQEARELRLIDDSVALPDIQRVRERVKSTTGVQHGFAARDPRLRVEMVKNEGGTTLTEAAVARALRWLQRHQFESGRFGLHDYHRVENCSCAGHGLHDDTAGTALALLPFLGAGQNHLTGKYRDEVARGLRWLIRHQKEDGDLRSHLGTSGMYAQGQATIVLCEAFAMTGDEELRVPAQRAVDFIVKAQYHDGGWRYNNTSLHEPGDTSVVGWQLMALQSARAANLTVPESTFKRASSFLNRVQFDDGAFYAYQPGREPTPTMTAEGLLCRLYLGWTKSEPGLNTGVRHLLKNHPPTQRRLGIYYWYYATQTFHHYGGQPWQDWNRQMRDVLVESQSTSGHAAGSWSPEGEHSEAGGRIYMTSLAACTLEVYYRHLPIFRQIQVD